MTPVSSRTPRMVEFQGGTIQKELWGGAGGSSGWWGARLGNPLEPVKTGGVYALLKYL